MAEYFACARALRQDARRWWYHTQLRKEGNATEARVREHRSVRDHIRQIRQTKANGGFLSIGRGGTTLHVGIVERGEHSTTDERLSAYDDLVWATLAGILTVDTRIVPLEHCFDMVRWPMPVPDSSDDAVPLAEARSLDYCRISDMLPRYRAVGARIVNG